MTNSARLDVVGLGESSLDHVCVLPSLEVQGEKVTIDDYAARPGGQVATTLLGCARLGLRTAYWGCVGDDFAAERVLAPLEEAGVDLSGLRRIEGARTRLAVVLVDGVTGDRRVLGYRDAGLRWRERPGDVGRLRGARALHIDATDPEASLWAAQAARRAGMPVILDADRVDDGVCALLPWVDFPVVSRPFAEEWGQTGEVRDGLERLAREGARFAIATLGERGACAFESGRHLESPAWRVDAVDTTGAGDAFRAGFLWALLAGREPEECLRRANAVGALACTGAGAQGGLPEPTRVEALLAEGELLEGAAP